MSDQSKLDIDISINKNKRQISIVFIGDSGTHLAYIHIQNSSIYLTKARNNDVYKKEKKKQNETKISLLQERNGENKR